VHKIVFIGEPGVGKTTCVGRLSQIAPIVTDVEATDELAERKVQTTVAMDYGELDLDDHGRLFIYGLPGQARFRFMFDVVEEGLLGVVLLVDASHAGGIGGLRETLDVYADKIRSHATVVALNRSQGSHTFVEGCQSLLEEFDLVAPILRVDARLREDVGRAVELLIMMAAFADRSDDQMFDA